MRRLDSVLQPVGAGRDAILLVARIGIGIVFVAHLDNGVFVTEGGWELVAALGLASLILVAVGPGRLSVDNALVRPRTPSRRRVLT